jgi:hypothetical protein
LKTVSRDLQTGFASTTKLESVYEAPLREPEAPADRWRELFR